MKIFVPFFSFLIILYITPSNQIDYNYYTVDSVINYFDGEGFKDEENQCIVDNISKLYSNVYAFYDIAKNPPQPSFSKDYHPAVDLEKKFKEINTKDSNVYDLYRNIVYILADLKDSHLRVFFENNDIGNFNILGPFDYRMGRDADGKVRMYADCIAEDELEYFKNIIEDDNIDIEEFCNSNDAPIKSINNQDPFDYVTNFGGNLVSTKNVHGTFSFKMSFINDVSLNDFPLSPEELNNLEVVFDDEDNTVIKTKYIIKTELNIDEEEDEEEGNRLRALSHTKRRHKNHKTNSERSTKKSIHKKKLEKKNKRISRKKGRKLSTQIIWDYNCEDEFKCYKDDEYKLNIYYVGTFEPEDREEYLKVMKQCVELFDKNTYPIVVVNELNNGGYVSLSQIFLGILSPLMPINLYKGRLRLTDNLKKTDELEEYINKNLISVKDCQKANYDYLMDNQVSVDYSGSKLSEIFYISNSTIHNEIENIRKTMKNKRKPTEILVLTDGFSFSSAALYIKYLQKMGGAIVAGYYGNPNSNEPFDSAQSPSSVFISNILNTFSKEETEKLKSGFDIILEVTGVQTFYDLEDKNVPLEYEVTPVDLRLDIYEQIEDSYQTFVETANKIFEDKNKCYKNNVINFSEECDASFKNNYTHGGYACNDDGTWDTVCVAAYCDMGYRFDHKKKKCVKDVCSSVIVPDDDDEETQPEEKAGPNDQFLFYVVIGGVVGLILLFIIVFCCICCKQCKSRRVSSTEIEK